jgi:hypothetical protein
LVTTGDPLTWRGQGFVFDYKTFGSPGDISIDQGVNVNSSPAAAAYTSIAPDQTSILVFAYNGAQQFDISDYWTSSDYAFDSAGTFYTNAWTIYFGSGEEQAEGKAGTRGVRAVRRSII